MVICILVTILLSQPGDLAAVLRVEACIRLLVAKNDSPVPGPCKLSRGGTHELVFVEPALELRRGKTTSWCSCWKILFKGDANKLLSPGQGYYRED